MKSSWFWFRMIHLRNGLGCRQATPTGWKGSQKAFQELNHSANRVSAWDNRWWNENNKSIWREESWLHGLGWHGILRDWNGKGRLCRGFPQFYVNGERLTERQYLCACESDQSIPPYVPEQDQQYRTLPKEYLAQRQTGRIRDGSKDR